MPHLHEFPQQDLTAALRTAARVAPRRTTVPVLGHARVAVRDDGCVDVLATDLTTTVEIRVAPARANGSREPHGRVAPWAALLPAHPASRVAAALDCATVQLQHEGRARGGTVDVSAGEGSGTWSFNYGASAGSALDDFPATAFLRANRAVATIPDKRAFVDLLRAVVYAADEEAVRPEYSGVLLTAKRGVLCLTAANGHRLARTVGPWPGADLTWHVPAAAVRLLLDVADAARDDVRPASIRVFEHPGTHTAVFRLGPVTIAARLLAEQPKAWDEVIAAALEPRASCAWHGKADVLARAVRGAAIVSAQPGVTLQFTPDGLCVRTTDEHSRAAVLAQGTSCTRVPEAPTTVGVTWRYLGEALVPFGDAPVTLHAPVARGPIVVRRAAHAMPLALVMPLAADA